jgi:glycosyltransferase involved in cell wall biosynthesis
MPVYNGGDYFELALQSALAQDYPNVEIVVVNDGSTDDGHTERVALSYGDRIRYFHQPNGGVAAALNNAIAHATGDYFAWLSHDDIHLPEKTSSQIRFLEQIGKPDACLFSDYDLIGPDDEPITTVRMPTDRIRLTPRLPLFNGMINGCSLLIPMKYMRHYGPFDEALRYTQDYDMWHRILRDHEFLHQPEVLIRYRIHPGQDTQKPQVVHEVNPLWIRMTDSLSPTERTQMFGSSRRYFSALTKFLGYSKADEAIAHAKLRAEASLGDTLVSVVMAFWNEVPLACQAVRSALDQEGCRIEVIVVDDGSSDDTTEMQQLAASDSRIKLLRQPNGGPASARNRGMLHAHGEYIAFLDADDRFLPTKVCRQVERMASHGAMFSHTSYYISYPELTDSLGIMRSGRFSGEVYPAIIAGCPIAMPTVMLHRAVVDAGFAFPSGGRIGEDVLAWADLAARYVLLGIDEPLSIVEWASQSAALDLDKQIVGMNGMLDVLSAHPLHGRYKDELHRLELALGYIIGRWSADRGAAEPPQISLDSPANAGAWALDASVPLEHHGYLSFSRMLSK